MVFYQFSIRWKSAYSEWQISCSIWKTGCKKSYSEILDHKLDAQFHGGEMLHHHWLHETVCSCVYTVIIERKCGFLMVICAIKEIIKYLKIIINKQYLYKNKCNIFYCFFMVYADFQLFTASFFVTYCFCPFVLSVLHFLQTSSQSHYT